MCKRNFPHKYQASRNSQGKIDASMGFVRGTSPIKQNKKKTKTSSGCVKEKCLYKNQDSTGCVSETPKIKKKESCMGCVSGTSSIEIKTARDV